MSKAQPVITVPAPDTPSIDLTLTGSAHDLTQLSEDKSQEGIIKSFTVELNGGHTYQPGEELSGKVILDLSSFLDVGGVDLALVGGCILSSLQQRPLEERELHLHQSLSLMPVGRSGKTRLPAGTYTMAFRYTLPSRLPPSIPITTLASKYRYSLSYNVHAWVCSPRRPRGDRPIINTMEPFTVSPSVALATAPGALDPVVHADQFQLSCSSKYEDLTSAMVTLNQHIYVPGNTISMTTEIITPKRGQIKSVTTILQQDVVYRGKRPATTSIRLSTRHEKPKRSSSSHHTNILRNRFTYVLPSNALPSVLPNTRLIQVSYKLKVKVQFGGLRGKLSITMPLTVACPSPMDSHTTLLSNGIHGKLSLRSSLRSENSNTSRDHREVGQKVDKVLAATTRKMHERIRMKYQSGIPACCC